MPTKIQAQDTLDIFQSSQNQLYYILITRDLSATERNKIKYSYIFGEQKFGFFMDSTIYLKKDEIIELAKDLKRQIENLSIPDKKLDILF